MELLFLGTSAAVPSRERSTSCVAVRDGQDIVLLDCGEGAQRQMMASPFSFMRIRAVLISHLHGDHVFGLPGLLQTMGLSDRRDPLVVCGPPGLKGYLEASMSFTEGETTYPVEIAELSGGEWLDVRRFRIGCFRTEHGISSLGYVIRGPDSPGRLDHRRALELGIRDGPDMARLKNGETVNGVSPEQVIGPVIPGFTVAYTGDTRPCDRTVESVRGADVLIHEATYTSAESDNAREHNHSTALQAAEVARAAGVGHLILTHISNRYDDRSVLESEARAVFPESYVADDMRMYTVLRSGIRLETPQVRRA